ncbi:alanine racemase [Pseudanabaena sp. FACHB-2040]|uniref:diaminopimelate decarboxylase family protein n=1 Tax=Pseudanabaena sp. FACHB-2040 TaxID=2692859 RepID=UPI0016890BD6|nr:alanine racemase [Pseudanabaena sp. FACHB-2040]MBD2260929.1 alanine racemase [Pseudanabaena sp. FACHB-2040]
MLKFTAHKRLKSELKTFIKAAGQQWLSTAAAQNPRLSPELWQLEYVGNELAFRGRALSSLLSKWGTPLHIVDEAKLISNLESFQKVADGFEDGLEVFYSYKTNPLPWVFEVLHQQGAGAEVISEYELWLALKLGVPADKIIYNGPAKSQASLEAAIDKNILSININNAEELDRISALAAALGKTARVGIRVTSAAGWTGQFGLPVETGAALEVFRQALAQPELSVTTLHCHRGNLIYDEDTLQSHLHFLLKFVDELKEKLNWIPAVLDVGGSLATPTVRYLSKKEIKLATTFLVPPSPPEPQSVLTPQAYAETVVRVVRSHFQQQGYPQPRIVSEPGRSLTGNSQFMLTTVQNLKHDASFDFAVLDAGINLASCVASEYHEVFPLQLKSAPMRCHRLVGPICHMGDTLYMASYLPQLERQDALAIMDSGAYFIADATSFAFSQPAVVAITTSGQEVLIRKAESFDHLVSLDHFAAKEGQPS